MSVNMQCNAVHSFRDFWLNHLLRDHSACHDKPSHGVWHDVDMSDISTVKLFQKNELVEFAETHDRWFDTLCAKQNRTPTFVHQSREYSQCHLENWIPGKATLWWKEPTVSAVDCFHSQLLGSVLKGFGLQASNRLKPWSHSRWCYISRFLVVTT